MNLRSEEPQAIDLEFVHRALKYSLDQLFQVLREKDIDCWLDFGTLLGSVRESEILAWDDDVDLAILRRDVDGFKEVVSHKLSHLFNLSWQSTSAPIAVTLKIQLKGLKTVEKEMSKRGILETYHPNIGIDVFVLDPRSESPRLIEKLYRNLLSRIWQSVQIRNFVGQDPALQISFKRKVMFLIVKVLPRSLVHYLIHREISRNIALEDARFLYHGVDTEFCSVISHAAEIFPLSDEVLGGIVYPTPREAYSYLIQLYGPTAMTPPPLSERKTHSSRIWIDKNSPFFGANSDFGKMGL
jgi:lipopolysaccharide cholinephosphotransferase